MLGKIGLHKNKCRGFVFVSVIIYYQKLLNETLLKNLKKEEPKTSKNCPESWLAGEATCFKTIDEVGDFYQSIITCTNQGGALAVIDNEREWAFIAGELNASCGYWIGSTDRGHEGNWISVDGTAYAGYAVLFYSFSRLFIK